MPAWDQSSVEDQAPRAFNDLLKYKIRSCSILLFVSPLPSVFTLHIIWNTKNRKRGLEWGCLKQRAVQSWSTQQNTTACPGPVILSDGEREFVSADMRERQKIDQVTESYLSSSFMRIECDIQFVTTSSSLPFRALLKWCLLEGWQNEWLWNRTTPESSAVWKVWLEC